MFFADQKQIAKDQNILSLVIGATEFHFGQLMIYQA
jgi:hypothetical protein